MPNNMTAQKFNKVITSGLHDAILDGEITRDIQTRMVFVNSESELAQFTDQEPAGTVAATYGFGSMWQLTPAGTWAEI